MEQNDYAKFIERGEASSNSGGTADAIRPIADSYHMHNFSVGTLETYYNLGQSGFTYVETEYGFQILGGPKRLRTFVLGDHPDLELPDVVGPIYGTHKSKFLDSKQVEIVNRLDKFDGIVRKRKDILVSPRNWARNYNVEFRAATPDDIPALELIHKKWMTAKMDDTKTMRNMFPTRRYINCARVGVRDPSNYVVRMSNECFQVAYVSGCHAYGLAGIGLWRGWLAQASDLDLFDVLAGRGVTHYNSGIGMGKSLKRTKTKYPYDLVTWYQHSRSKNKKITTLQQALDFVDVISV